MKLPHPGSQWGKLSTAAGQETSFIEDQGVIKAILKHLGLWLVKSKPAPKAHAPPARNRDDSEPVEIVLEHFCQLPLNDDHLHRDADYPWEAYLQP